MAIVLTSNFGAAGSQQLGGTIVMVFFLFLLDVASCVLWLQELLVLSPLLVKTYVCTNKPSLFLMLRIHILDKKI